MVRLGPPFGNPERAETVQRIDGAEKAVRETEPTAAPTLLRIPLLSR